ncbi:MAG TPA: hypothetical protein VMW63_05660 [Methanoregulaceae archaeon]|nr:hypothetical protein [Methanoregulaceae archaeon]
MKKVGILIIALVLLTGLAVADRGIDPVPETQGIVTSTTIDAVGNFASVSEIQWRITDDEDGLTGIPPLTLIQVPGPAIYESVYAEDTYSSGVGLIGYDKELDVETSGQISGQWNIEAIKELAYVGVDGSRVFSDESIFVDGAGLVDTTDVFVICPFAEDVTIWFPGFCNRAEAGSTIDMTVANARTTSTDRFVMPSADHPVELNHDIRVSELVTNLPSMGMASTYMETLIQEGPANTEHVTPNPDHMVERIEFSESTTIDGDITLFEKLMHYESGMVR